MTTVQGPRILTATGRRSLERKLLEAADRQREMAEQAGRAGRVPDEDEYRLATARVAELQTILNRSVAPASVPDDPSIIELGDAVKLLHGDGTIEQVVLTDPIEATADEANVSIDSPLGRALSGRRAGEQVDVPAPAGTYTVLIIDRSRAH